MQVDTGVQKSKRINNNMGVVGCAIYRLAVYRYSDRQAALTADA